MSGLPRELLIAEGRLLTAQKEVGARGWVGKVGKRAPTLETVAELLSSGIAVETIHTFVQFSYMFVRTERDATHPLGYSLVTKVCRCLNFRVCLLFARVLAKKLAENRYKPLGLLDMG